MHSAKFLAVAAAFFGSAIAKDCDDDIEVKEPNPVLSCDTVKGKIIVDDSVTGDLVLEGPEKIEGDLIINNATGIISISSSTIESVEGKFELVGLESLQRIGMNALTSINELEMRKLPALRDLTFGSKGVTEATVVTITDTLIDDLSGLMLDKVESLDINNNKRLTNFESSLVNVTDSLKINNNGKGMTVTMASLESAKEIQIANVGSFNVPALETVSASLKLDKCDIKSFRAANLTSIKNALSFINNVQITNISLPVLKDIGGDLRIVNNTKLTDIGSFPKLESMASINFGGNFKKGELPALEDVPGAAEISTTAKDDDGEEFCSYWDDLGDKVQGGVECTYDNENALEGGDKEGGQNSDGSSKGDDDDAAGMVSVNTALMSLGLLAGIAQLL